MCLSPHCSLWINWGDDRVKCSHDWWPLMKSNILSPRHHLAELGLERKAFNMSWWQEIHFKAAFSALARALWFSLWPWLEFLAMDDKSSSGRTCVGHCIEFSHLKTMMGGLTVIQRFPCYADSVRSSALVPSTSTCSFREFREFHMILLWFCQNCWKGRELAVTPCGTQGAFHVSVRLGLTVKGVKDTYLMRWI